MFLFTPEGSSYLTLLDADISIYDDSQSGPGNSDLRRRHTSTQSSLAQGADNFAQVAKTVLILDTDRQRRRNSFSTAPSISRHSTKANDVDNTLSLSRHATIGRNSDFRNMTQADWERVGGIEYRSLKLLLKIVFCECLWFWSYLPLLMSWA